MIGCDTPTLSARQQRYALRRLKRFEMGPQMFKKLYSCTVESILTGCITAWYGNLSASTRKALQRVVRTAQYITGAMLTAVQDLYSGCSTKGVVIKLQYLEVMLGLVQYLASPLHCSRPAQGGVTALIMLLGILCL